jgi:hypothetical protein
MVSFGLREAEGMAAMTRIVEQHEADWQRGYDAAMNARPYVVPEGVKDRFGFARGYAEGSAARRKAIKVARGEAG